MKVAWLIEHRLEPGQDWIPYKLAGRAGSYVTRASAREEAEDLDDPRFRGAWRYRVVAYSPRIDSRGRRR